MEREHKKVHITGSGSAGVIGNNNDVRIGGPGHDDGRNPSKDRIANRLGLIAIVVFALGVLVYLVPANAATLTPETGVLRSTLIALCAGLAPIAAAYLVWRWKD